MKESVGNKEKYIWNILGGLSSSGSSLVLSIAVNRILGGAQGGVFAFAYANAQLMYTIGAFEVRPYQSTDVKENYKFNTYVSLRIVTCAFMVLATIIYVLFNDFPLEKSIIVVLMTIFKMLEAFADVYAGRFQQRDRIDLSGKLYFVRMVTSVMAFIFMLLVTNNMMIASLVMCLVSGVLLYVYDYRQLFSEDKGKMDFDKKNLMTLLKEVLPLFIGAFIMMYISNAPKYAIEMVYNDDMQNIYNILFMPAFVINMFSIFVFRPLMITMAQDWATGDLKSLRSILVKIYLMICGLTCVALIGTWMLGIPILSIIYGVNLASYKDHLMMVMLGGGISAMLTFSCQVITIMRQQKIMLLGYLIAFIYAFAISKHLVMKWELTGAILAYSSAMGLLVIFCMVIIVYRYIKRKCI